MGLEIFVDKVKPYDGLHEGKKLGAVPTCLGIYLGNIGIPEITSANYLDVHLRLCKWQQVQGGGPFVKDGVNYKLTLRHVYANIGLRTNHASLTGSQFNLRLRDELASIAERQHTRALKRMALEDRGYLFCDSLRRAVDAFMALDGGVDLSSTLLDLHRYVEKLGPDDWYKLHDNHTFLGGVTEANLGLHNLADGFDLGTPVHELVAIDDALKAKEPVA